MMTPLQKNLVEAGFIEEPPEPAWPDALSTGAVSSQRLATLTLPAREPLIADWCFIGDLGYIFAARGLGKTWKAMHLAIGVALQRDVGPWKIHRQLRVLYLDGEMPANSIQHRDKALGGRCENLTYINHEILFERTGRVMNLASTDFQSAVLDYCQSERFELLFLDNLSTLTSGVDENKSIDWELIQPWLLRLRRHHVTVIFIHHAGRNSEMRGTSKREDPASWVLRLDPPTDAIDKPGAHFVTRFTKWRNATQKPKTYQWVYSPAAQGEVLVEAKEASPIDVFRSCLESGLDSCTELAEEMGVTKGYVSQLATQAEKEGWLKKEGKRKYALL